MISKSRRAQKYIRLAKRADKLIAKYSEYRSRTWSSLDLEIERQLHDQTAKHMMEVLTPEVLEGMKANTESLARTSAEIMAQGRRMDKWLRSQQEKEWKEKYKRPLPGGALLRSKRLRKKRDIALQFYA